MGFLDNAIKAISPSWAAKRELNKARASFMADSGGGLGTYYGPYSGATASRVSSPWFVSPTNPAFRFISEVALREMRNRARTLERSNEIARGLLDRTVENVVGPKGFQLQVMADNPAWTPEKNTAWRNQAQKLMEGWFPTADITGLPWVEHQRVVVKSVLRDGDVGVVLDKDGYLQGVEGDLIADPDDKGDNCIFGVEVDVFSRPIAYWITPLPTDDGKGTGTNQNKPQPQRISTDDMIFVANTTRFGQLRGETVFCTIFDLLDQISQWKQATLMAARIAACFGLAITKNDGGASAFSAGSAQPVSNSSGINQPQVTIEPGMIQYLQPNEKIETINPANPGHNFPQNLTAMVRLAGLPFGMPLELVMLDFSKTNYSSARGSMQQAYRKFQSWQQFFIYKYLKRVYQWRISKFIKAGLLEANPDAWNHRWISQPWPFLDPIKELQAIQMSIDIGADTLTSVLQAQGRDLASHITQRGDEIALLTAANIPILHSQALMQYTTTATGQADPDDPDDADDSNDDEQDNPIDDDNETDNEGGDLDD